MSASTKIGDELEARRGTAVCKVRLTMASPRAIVVYWPNAGDYHVHTETGELQSTTQPLNGHIKIDLETHPFRVRGTRYSLPPSQVALAMRAVRGDTLAFEHDVAAALVSVTVQSVRDRGTALHAWVTTPPQAAVGVLFGVHWTLSPEALAGVRKLARLPPLVVGGDQVAALADLMHEGEDA